MALDQRSFLVHDVSSFPIVRTRPDAMPSDYATQWQAELDALLADGRPFVLIYEVGRPEETHEDRRQRAIWLKQNRQAVSELCLGIIAIEPNTIKRAALKAQSFLASKAFGVSSDVAANRLDAEQMAGALLPQSAG